LLPLPSHPVRKMPNAVGIFQGFHALLCTALRLQYSEVASSYARGLQRTFLARARLPWAHNGALDANGQVHALLQRLPAPAARHQGRGQQATPDSSFSFGLGYLKHCMQPTVYGAPLPLALRAWQGSRQGAHRSRAERAIQKLSACSEAVRSPHSSSAVTPYTTSDAEHPRPGAKRTHPSNTPHTGTSRHSQVPGVESPKVSTRERGPSGRGGWGGRGARLAKGSRSREDRGGRGGHTV